MTFEIRIFSVGSQAILLVLTVKNDSLLSNSIVDIHVYVGRFYEPFTCHGRGFSP